jgi:anti-sigma factor ChrR (cupin superfamily)
MQHNTVTDEIREFASLYAVGALNPEEAGNFERHLRDGCAVCAAEVRAFEETAALLPLASSAAPAPDQVREKLFARVRSGEAPPAAHLVRSGDGVWVSLGVPGVTAKTLFQESAGGNTTMLIRMQPGAVYPPHRHAAIEHCYVLEGDLRFGDLVMRAGDYQCAMGDTTHETSRTEKGCLLLIVASTQNTVLP